MTDTTQAPAETQETTETPAPAEPVAAPAAADATKQEAVAKAQEVGKKLSGFLGSLAEKAKNIDVKELAEKAKNIDVKELTEKAKQKVNEVKDKASEINAGKVESSVPARETLTAEQVKELFASAASAIDEVPPVVQAVLTDVTQGEQVALKMKFGDTVFIALSDKSLFQFIKTSDQYAVNIYPVSEIRCFSVLAPRGETAGRLSFYTAKEEIKLSLSSMEAYAKALILYKKVREK